MHEATASRFPNYAGTETVGFNGSHNETLAYIDHNRDGTADVSVVTVATDTMRIYKGRKYSNALGIVERHLKAEGYDMPEIPESALKLPDRIIL